MKEDRQHKVEASRIIQSKGSEGNPCFVDNRPYAIAQAKLINEFCSQLTRNESKKSLISERINNYRSSQVCQLAYKWSKGGADGVLMGEGETYVIKFDGYDSLAPELDRIAADQFGLNTANTRIINKENTLWQQEVERALSDVDHKNKKGNTIDPQTALLMTRVDGRDLYDFSENIQDTEKRKIACFDLGKILVMDLLTRNYDRFNLSDIKDRLGFSESDAEAHSSAHSSSDSSWNAWDGNGENMLIDEDGHVAPIDSQFSLTDNEPIYAQNVASLLTENIDLLIESGMKILNENGWNEKEFKDIFKKGVMDGIQCLMS